MKRHIKAFRFFLYYWLISAYQPVKAFYVRRKCPCRVGAGPTIVLVGGENGPDKMSSYRPIYSVYLALRDFFNVRIAMHVSLSKRHLEKLARSKPDLVVLTFDNGHFQTVLEELGIPFMGSGPATCRMCYDKVNAKERIAELGIATAPWLTLGRNDSADSIQERLGFPVVIKPRRGGSSYGVSKVDRPQDVRAAMLAALGWDNEVLVERYIPGREYTCTVYGNDSPRVLTLNRKIMTFELAEMRFRGETVSAPRFPIVSREPFVEEIYEMSKRIYAALNCRDMARIDWKYDDRNDQSYVLEINTLPWIGRSGGNIEECARAEGSSYEEFILNLFLDSLARTDRNTSAGHISRHTTQSSRP